MKENKAMTDNVNAAFEDNLIGLDLDQILPVKKLNPTALSSQKFKQIISSIEEIGVIEPLVVHAKSGQYLLLDGHLRLEALKKLNHTKVICLISKDDETFTYNRYISRKAPIQEHRMIKKMVDHGVSEEKIAKTLNINVKSIMQKRSLLDGICEEAIDLLKDKMATQNVFFCLKKMKPTRQIECAMMMVDMNDFSNRYAQGLLAMSQDAELIVPKKKIADISISEKRVKMQEELEKLEREYKLTKDDRGQKNLTLQFTKKYINRLLDNENITNFLKKNYADIFEEFQVIANMESLKTL
jgi:hypothetical protein